MIFFKRKSKDSKISKFKRKKQLQLNQFDMCLTDDTPFSIIESYKTVRTNLLYSIAANKTKVIIISSAGANEGKSTTCSNISITLSQTSSKVLLIDADMRKPNQHKIFKLDNSFGLSSLVGGFKTICDTVQKDVRPNLDVLTAGQIPPNPTELLSSQNMKDLMKTFTQDYDYIIIDTPPVNLVSDALVLIEEDVGIVFICRQNQTTSDEIKRAVESVKFTGAKILGIVVSFVSSKEKIYKSYKHKNKKEYLGA